MPVAKGTRLGRYEVRSLIGAGGMGEVYLAFDAQLDRTVALKFLPAEVACDQGRMRRFIQEARAASALNHPNIITVHEIGQADSACYIVTEFVEGETLRRHMTSARMKVGDVLDIACQVAGALARAHQAGIVHRDVKPENVMVRADGIVKVLDFGLAKLAEPRADAPDTQAPTRAMVNTDSGVVLGTALYMSPEQVRALDLDPRTDIWSLGVLLYEMLAGRAPFEGATNGDIIAAIIDREPPPLARFSTDVPHELERIVAKALAKDREERYQTVKDLLIDLKNLRRRLEFEAELDRSVAPELRKALGAATKGGGHPSAAAARASAAPTAEAAARPTSSAEFVVNQFRRHKRGFALVALALTLVAVAGLFVYLRRAPALTDKDTILLADFVNTTGDPVFDDTLKQGLAMELQQSPFLNIFPEARVRETLRQMERAPDERVTVETGREICQRNGLKALIAGSIAALGSHYVITLEAINAGSGEEIARQQAEAQTKEEVLKSLSSAVSGIREKLGESLSSIRQSDIPLYQLTTPSLDALKSFALGFDRSNKGKYFESIPLFKRATELDPNFAYGYSLLAGNYTIVSEPRRAAENAARAFALKEKVSDREKLYITYVYDNYTLGDLDKAIEVLRVYSQSYPNDFRTSGNLSLVYLLLGQFETAVGEARESVRLNPDISAWHVTLGTALTRLGRYAEAKEAFERALQAGLDDPRMHGGLYQIAFVARDEAAMQQQLDWARSKPEEYLLADLQTGAAAYLGQWRQSQSLAQRAVELASRVDLKEVAARYAAEQALRAAVLDRCEQAKSYDKQSLALERNQVTLERVALSQAICGDGQAQSLVEELGKQHPSDTTVNGLWLPTLRAATELARGNSAKAVESLGATRAYEPAAEFWTRYLRGQAYLKSNKGSEAAAEFQQILSRRGEAPLSVLYPLSQLGLARAFALTGDAARARQAYQDFFALWKEADPDIHVLQAARQEYERLSR